MTFLNESTFIDMHILFEIMTFLSNEKNFYMLFNLSAISFPKISYPRSPKWRPSSFSPRHTSAKSLESHIA